MYKVEKIIAMFSSLTNKISDLIDKIKKSLPDLHKK